LAADKAGFSRIAHGQYAIFIALRSCNESRVSNGKKYLKVFQTIQNREKEQLLWLKNILNTFLSAKVEFTR
jgi:hypothetical protein